MENNFENEWQKAFDDAYIFPPVKVWKNIESQLPPSQPKRRWWLWILVFLGITTLSGLGGYWLATSKTELSGHVNIAPNQANKIAEPVLTLPQNQPIVNPKTRTDLAINKTQSYAKSTSQKILSVARLVSSKTENSFSQYNDNQIVNSEKKANSVFLNLTENQNITTDNNATNLISQNKTPGNTLLNFDKLNCKLAKPMPVYLPMPDLAFGSTNIKKTPLNNTPKSWIGLSLGIARFNPNMQFDAQNLNAYNNVGSNNSNNVSGNGLAYQLEIKAGKTLGKRWMITSGIQYTKANGTLLSNAYWIDRLTSTKASFVSVLLSPNPINSNPINDKLSNAAATNVLLPSAKPVDQAASWTFICIPTKLGYQIKTDGKTAWFLMTGISADFFLKNQITSTTALPAKTLTRADQVYNPLNFSGLIGLRASYQFNKSTFMSFDASYQRAMSSGLPEGTSIQFRPTSLGLNVGINWQLGK